MPAMQVRRIARMEPAGNTDADQSVAMAMQTLQPRMEALQPMVKQAYHKGVEIASHVDRIVKFVVWVAKFAKEVHNSLQYLNSLQRA